MIVGVAVGVSVAVVVIFILIYFYRKQNSVNTQIKPDSDLQ